jgi:hypothetical protein
MISIEKNFLFVHIPKTGGNSLQQVLKHYSEDEITFGDGDSDGKNRFGVYSHRYGTSKHSTLRDYYASLEPDLFNRLFKFAVIRNPWDRMVSAYFSPHRGNVQWDRHQFIRTVKSSFTLRDYVTIPKWISRFSPRVLKHTNVMMARVSKTMDVRVDFIARFESLDDDFKEICSRLDIPYSKLPVRNKGDREHYSVYYDDELKEVVCRKFQEEIDMMHYRFEYY